MLGWAEGLNFCVMTKMARRKTKNKQEWRDESFCDVLRNEKNGEAQK